MRIVPILALAVLAACQTAPAPKPLIPPPENLEQLVHDCQRLTGRNFTYTEEIGARMRKCDLRPGKIPPYPPEDSFSLLTICLTVQGLELVRVGPEHLNVWQVREDLRPNPRHDGPVRLDSGSGG